MSATDMLAGCAAIIAFVVAWIVMEFHERKAQRDAKRFDTARAAKKDDPRP